MSRAVRGFVAFLAWTLFSFYAHYFARKALRTWGNIPQEQQETTEKKKALWYAVVILSLCQIVVGACVLLLLPRLCSRRLLTWMGLDAKESMSADPHSDTGVEKVTNGVTQGQEEPCESSRLPNTDLSLVTLSVSHMAATMCTNASLAFCDASSAFTVKAFEPITTAVLSSILSGKKLETNTIIALPLVVIGSIGFVWRPQYRMGETLGLTLAFLSNILFGLRNVTLKSMANKTPLVQVQTLAKMSTWAAFLLLFMEIFLAVAAPDMFPTLLAAGLLQPCLVSAILHVTYTVISTCIILKYISVVAHSMANLMKRISLALLFYMIGKHLLLPVNYFSGTVIILGLALYVFPAATRQKNCSEQQSLWLTVIMSSIVLAMAGYHWGTALPGNSVEIATAVSSNTTSVFQFPFSRIRPFTRTDLSPKDRSFVNADLYADSSNAFHLSQLLTTTEEVIEEAQRIQTTLFSRVLAGYKRAVLVNVFQWPNKGDQFITIGQRLILQGLNISIVYHCYYPGTYCDFSQIKRSKDLVVMVQGAGYIGHPAHLYVLKKTADAFPRNRIVQFPTSVCHPTPGCQNITKFAQIYGNHKDFIVMLRDKPSFDMASHFFLKNKLLLVPDSAFAAGPLQVNVIPSYDVIWIKRDDWESPGFTSANRPKFPPGIKYLITDWKAEWMNENADDFFEDHQLKAMSGVLFIARAHVVVTDRLHAHLISTLLGKPNVVVNSLTNKQANYYHTWERSIRSSHLALSTEHAVEKALLLLKRYKPVA